MTPESDSTIPTQISEPVVDKAGRRSRTISENKALESDSSLSDGDDIMLQVLLSYLFTYLPPLSSLCQSSLTSPHPISSLFLLSTHILWSNTTVGFFQQCISSAMPISKKKLPKSSSDGSMEAANRSSRSVPRSKTFGSKLRIAPKKAMKAAQFAKVCHTDSHIWKWSFTD